MYTVKTEEHHSSLPFFLGKCQIVLLFSVMRGKRQAPEACKQNVKLHGPLGNSNYLIFFLQEFPWALG